MRKTIKKIIKNKGLNIGLLFLIVLLFSIRGSIAANLLAPCQINATDAEANPYTFSLTQTTSGVSIDASTGIISGSSATEGSYTIEIMATDEYGAESELVSYELSVNNYCGDNVKQEPNMEGQGGPANNGMEDCDGQDGIAINPADSIEGNKMYACSGACVEGTDCTDSCTYLDANNGGGWCGDGVVQVNFGEACDPAESKESYAERMGMDEDLIDPAYWQAISLSCDPVTCITGCANDPLLAEGCYLGASCQKGKYICVANSVQCADVFTAVGGAKFDYCCEGEAIKIRCANGNTAPGCVAVPDIGAFTVVRANSDDVVFDAAGGYYGSFIGVHSNIGETFYYYTCDYVCKQTGRICIGVGLNNHEIMACTSVVHDSAGNCFNSGNTVYDDCRSYFSLAGASTALSSMTYTVAGYQGTCSDGSNLDPPLSPYFYVGETACYCQ